ncbi:MAG: acetoacetyl-CoA reductase [Sulfurifustaceae bacterium]
MARIVLITGGMGGIGEAICVKMAEAGYRVATTCSPGNTKCDDWLARMHAKGYDVFAVRCDVADYDSCQRAANALQEAVGPVDILVNNAGITRDMTFRKMDRTSWDEVINTNLNGVFNVTRPMVQGMLARGWGRIINISSVNGRKGAFGQTNYAAAKAGMHGFTMSLALELARKGVTVNTISPGYIATPMTAAMPKDALENHVLPQIPMGRLGRPDEVAALVRYLASEEAGFITGANIPINGGQHMD